MIAAKFCSSGGAKNALRRYLINLVFFANNDINARKIRKWATFESTEIRSHDQSKVGKHKP